MHLDEVGLVEIKVVRKEDMAQHLTSMWEKGR